MGIVHGLLNTIWRRDPIECGDTKCSRRVNRDDTCWVDVDQKVVFCDSCGRCVRYARKKAAERRGAQLS